MLQVKVWPLSSDQARPLSTHLEQTLDPPLSPSISGTGVRTRTNPTSENAGSLLTGTQEG
jgi:hypothetical protein